MVSKNKHNRDANRLSELERKYKRLESEISTIKKILECSTKRMIEESINRMKEGAGLERVLSLLENDKIKDDYITSINSFPFNEI